MGKKVKVFSIIVPALVLFVFACFAKALTEKEMWEKEYGDAYRLQPLILPVILENGGPDPGGYYYIDSFDPAINAPVFEWTDISSIGTPVTLTDDDNEGPFPIGFDFTFYGNTFNQFNICSNGFISFTSTSTRFSNDPIPDDSEPNNMLAIFWDDLNPANGGQVYYYTDTTSNRLIVSYDGVPHYLNTGSLYFQAVLSGEDSSIVFHYGVMDDAGHGNDGSTVGIENVDGTVGTEYRYNQAGIMDSMAVYFGFQAPYFGEHEVRPLNFIGLPIFGMVGDPITPEVSFVNSGANAEDFPVRVIINRGGTELYNQTEQVTGLQPGATVNVQFPDFTPIQEGTHVFTAISELVGDENPANDTIRTDRTIFSSAIIEDFETSNGAFVGDGDWEWGEPTSGPGGAHSGTKLWATALGGSYQNSTLSLLETPVYGLADSAVLGIWHWYDTELNFDGGNVKISTDDGVTWEVITPARGYDAVGNNSNPLSGEEIFSGHTHDFWQFDIFDLSAYAGGPAKFRFDFGSDGSVTYPGWYIDDFTVIGGSGAEPGYIAGIVTELSTGNPIEGAVVSAGSVSDSTDASGNYLLELIAGTYTVTASAMYYFPQTVNGIQVIEEDTTYQDFVLAAPGIQVDTTPITASVALGDTAMFTRNISNTGDGNLVFSVDINIGGTAINITPEIRPVENTSVARSRDKYMSNDTEYSPTYSPGNPPTILDFGDELYRFDAEGSTGDARILGIEFDGTNFWCTGANDLLTKKLHKYDRDGNHIETFNQGTTSPWGWRDLAWDGQYLYGSDENELAIIDPSTGQKIGELPMPNAFSPPLRALAWDPGTDHFWSANWASVIVEFDRNGTVINSYANSRSAYGMAWDNISEGGPFLWVYSQDGSPATQISQFNPATGLYTGVSFFAIDSSGNNASAGGMCFTAEWEFSLGVLACIIQDDVDMAALYEITPASQWLFVDPMSGTLAPAENVDLNILIDFTGDNIVPDTTYQATLTILNNTPDTPEIPITIDSQTGVDDEAGNLPREIALYQNYPNPFNPSTDIKFTLPEQMDVTIELFNILGQKTATIAEGLFPAGNNSVTWDAQGVASGIYYYRLAAGESILVKKMTIMK